MIICVSRQRLGVYWRSSRTEVAMWHASVLVCCLVAISWQCYYVLLTSNVNVDMSSYDASLPLIQSYGIIQITDLTW